jgi:hypothetical protein
MTEETSRPAQASDAVRIDDEQELAEWLALPANDGRIVQTRLRPSDRVIARVTDGIYRQPSSALRELISNAWDADANNVTILTDAPRFSRIYVRDDGVGMSHATLSRLLHHIGGSAKRNEEGQKLGITAADDPDRTRGGRPIIGKIGIGLFSVSQLAQRFRIVTKQSGADYRLIAEVQLRVYSEDRSEDQVRDDDDEFIAGDVYITREPTTDLDAHGTDIILDNVKPRVRDMLRSADRWRAVDERARLQEAGDEEGVADTRVEPPEYHTGWIGNAPEANAAGLDILTQPAVLPWTMADPAAARMGKLVDAVEALIASSKARPDIATVLDTYLQTVWNLGLSSPVGYVDQHPFDIRGASGVQLYWISNEPRIRPEEVRLDPDQSVREAVRARVPGSPELADGLDAPAGEFRVFFDGIELKRPVRFRPLGLSGKNAGTRPMLFVGQKDWDLSAVDPSRRGGDLALEGYLFWNGQVVPKENNGVLIRIRGTSGAAFDPTFFQYQVSELTRLRQITSELFIRHGLDAALNIDRESFNFAHPHVQLVTAWEHRAIRQLTNKQKEVGKKRVDSARAVAAVQQQSAVIRFSERVWAEQRGSEPPPEFAIAPDAHAAEAHRTEGTLTLLRAALPAGVLMAKGTDRSHQEAKAEALTRVLAAFGVLEERSYSEQERLIAAILEIFMVTTPE